MAILQAEQRSASGRNEYAGLCQRMTTSDGLEQKHYNQGETLTSKRVLGGGRGRAGPGRWVQQGVTGQNQTRVLVTWPLSKHRQAKSGLDSCQSV